MSEGFHSPVPEKLPFSTSLLLALLCLPVGALIGLVAADVVANKTAQTSQHQTTSNKPQTPPDQSTHDSPATELTQGTSHQHPADPAFDPAAAPLLDEELPDPGHDLSHHDVSEAPFTSTGADAHAADDHTRDDIEVPAFTPVTAADADDLLPSVHEAEAAPLSGAGSRTLQARGDLFLEAGQFAEALQAYRQSLGGGVTPTASLLFRMAAVAEACGEGDFALQAYRQLSGGGSQAMRRSALLGQVRIWEARDETGPAIDTAYGLLTQEPERGRDDPVYKEAIHVLGRVLTEAACPAPEDEWLNDHALVAPVFSRSPGLVLDNVRTMSIDVPVAPPTGNLSVRAYLPGDLSGTSVVADLPRASLQTLMQRLANALGLRVDASAASQKTLTARSAPLRCRSLNAALVLDAILAPAGLCWNHEGDTISVLTTEDLTREQAQAWKINLAQRAVWAAVAGASEHPRCPSSYLDAARTEMQLGDPVGALRWLKQAERLFSRTDVEAMLQFNLGKTYMLNGEFQNARKAFLKSVDSGHGQASEAAAYYYVGRLALEAEEHRSSVSALTRSVALRGADDLRARAVVLLAAANLFADNAHGANSVLMEHRELLSRSQVADIAAFLSALSRFRYSTDAVAKEREGRAVLGAVGHALRSPVQESAIQMLAAQAYLELGLSDAAEEPLNKVVRSGYRHPLQDAAMIQLAVAHWSNGQRSESFEVLQFIENDSASPWKRKAMLLLAEGALRNNTPNVAVTACKRLLSQDGIPQSERQQALRVLGKALQAGGQYQQAAYCFAGVAPDDLVAPEKGEHE